MVSTTSRIAPPEGWWEWAGNLYEQGQDPRDVFGWSAEPILYGDTDEVQPGTIKGRAKCIGMMLGYYVPKLFLVEIRSISLAVFNGYQVYKDPNDIKSWEACKFNAKVAYVNFLSDAGSIVRLTSGLIFPFLVIAVKEKKGETV